MSNDYIFRVFNRKNQKTVAVIDIEKVTEDCEYINKQGDLGFRIDGNGVLLLGKDYNVDFHSKQDLIKVDGTMPRLIMG